MWEVMEMWDSIPGHQTHSEQSLFDMLDEDIEIVLKSESHSGLINEDLMWNSTAAFGSLGSDFDSSILAGNIADMHSDMFAPSAMSQRTVDPTHSMNGVAAAGSLTQSEAEMFDPLFQRKLSEEYPNIDELSKGFDYGDMPSPLSEEFYDSCLSSPISIDSAEDSPLFDDAGFNSDIDVDNLIENLKQNNYNGVNTTPANAQSFLAAPYTTNTTQAIVHPQTYKTPASRSLMPSHILSNGQVVNRTNVRKVSATTARVVSASRGESIIMRPMSGVSAIQKNKTTTRGPVSMLTTTAQRQVMHAGNRTQLLKLSPKGRQATMLKTSGSNGMTNLSLLSTQDAMLKGASSMISPPASSDSDESIVFGEDCNREKSKTKKRISTSVCMPASRVASTNILASIQPNSATVFSQVTAVTGLSTIGHLAGQSPASSQSSPSSASQTKPIKRREHNDSERKRRDHLRTAFDELKQKVPKLANSERKPARIMILSEAANYAREITEADERNQIALQEAMAERHRLQQLIEHYRSHGLE